MLHVSDHALQRLQERGISAAEARAAVMNGSPVEQRLNGLRIQHDNIVVVLVIEPDAREATIITAWRTS